MTRTRLTVVSLFVLALGVVSSLVPSRSAGDQPKPPVNAGSWGDAVDGMACRLVMQPLYVTGQAISAVIEVKNTSDKKRFLVPRLDPLAIEHLTVELTGPNGKLKQIGFSKGYGLGEASFQPINPGETKRYEAVDLRDFFGDVPTGKYTARFRFRSPKVSPRFLVS